MAGPDLQVLRSIARQRKVSYRAIRDSDPLTVRTRMSRTFSISQSAAFTAFSDPQSHVPLFAIIKGTTPAIRWGVHKILPKNEFYVFEHVEEGGLPPRIMLVKYTLERPNAILKEAITDPFADGDIHILDRKRGRVRISFVKLTRTKTKIVTESTFNATTGAVFARPFIDLVWLNFFERMMLAQGEIERNAMLTTQYLRG